MPPTRLFGHGGLEASLTDLVVDADTVTLLVELEDNATGRTAVREYELAFQAWLSMPEFATRRREVAPPDPPAACLVGLPWRLSDDVGTVYVVRGAQAGGSGTEREAQIRWAPAPPPLARRGEVAVRGGQHVAFVRGDRELDWRQETSA